MCANTHLLARLPSKLRTSRKESAMTTQFAGWDENCPEHEHHSMIAAALVAFPVMIVVSLVGSLFGMA
jgi:hypothetical protein